MKRMIKGINLWGWIRGAALIGCCGLLLGSADAAWITLEYNGFNPGTDVMVYDGTSSLVTNHPGSVAGVTETNFVFELTAPDTYILDVWGGAIRGRASHRITFDFDGEDIDSIGDGANKVTGFTPNTNALTLYTVPVYIDPDGFNPPDDSPDGYIVQLEYGTSGRITLGDFNTFENGGRAGFVVNGHRYMIHYVNDRDSLGQQFVINNGVVAEEIGLIDEGLTTDADGDESGDTHQLIRLNRTSIHVDLNGLSHGVVLGDADNSSYPIEAIPAEFDGLAEILIHTDFGHTGYKFEYNFRLQRFGFDVDASGNIIELNDVRAFASGNKITFNTTPVKIDVDPGTGYSLEAKPSPANSNFSTLISGLSDDQELTLMPIADWDSGVYFLGGSTADARDAFRIVYDSEGERFTLTTWADAAGNEPVTDQESITLLNGKIVTILVPPLPGTVLLIR